MSDVPNPSPCVRIAFSRAKFPGRCRGRFGIVLFTHMKNIPTRTNTARVHARARLSTAQRYACRMSDKRFRARRGTRRRERERGFAFRVFLNTPFVFFSRRRSPCRRAHTRDDARRPRLSNPARRDVDGVRQSEKMMPETIFRAPTRARGSYRRRKRYVSTRRNSLAFDRASFVAFGVRRVETRRRRSSHRRPAPAGVSAGR